MAIKVDTRESSVVTKESLESARYRMLVEQLRDDLGGARGWVTRVAEHLGVSPSYVSKVAAGEARNVGGVAIGRAIERLGLERRFFEDESLQNPRFQDFTYRKANTDPTTFAMRVLRDRSQGWSDIADMASEALAKGPEELEEEDELRVASAIMGQQFFREVMAALRQEDGTSWDRLSSLRSFCRDMAVIEQLHLRLRFERLAEQEVEAARKTEEKPSSG